MSNLKYLISRKWRKKLSSQQAAQWFIRLNSSNLSKEEHKAFFTWLELSVENQIAYLTVEKAWEAGEAIRNYDTAIKKTHPFYLLQWSGALTIFFAIFLFIGFEKNYKCMSAIDVFSAAPGYQNISLQDGTKVVLGVGAEGSFGWCDNIRSFTLKSGKAYFEVTKNESSPFVVTSPLGIVKVHGTKFSVDLERQGGVVTVLEGTVGIAQKEHQYEDIITANQQHSFESHRARLPIVAVDADRLLSWRNTLLIFKGVKLVDAVAQLQARLNVNITLESSSQETSIVGGVSLENTESAIGSVAEIAKLEWKKLDHNKFVIYEK